MNDVGAVILFILFGSGIIFIIYNDCKGIDKYCKYIKKKIRTLKYFLNPSKTNVMINTKVLLKAMSFMFLPTLSVLLIIFFWFFSWSAFYAFITSQETAASWIRIIIMLLEVVLVIVMYSKLLTEEVKKELLNSKDGYGTFMGKSAGDYYNNVELKNLGVSCSKSENVFCFYAGVIDDEKVFVLTVKKSE